jgi:hypothetical protein
VSYRNKLGTKIATPEDSEVILNVTTLDGRALDNIALRNRIYEMKVELYTEEIVLGVPKRTVLSTMIGTKIE